MNIKPWHLLCPLVLATVLLFSLDTLPGYAALPARPVSLDDTRDHATTSASKLAQPPDTRIIVKKVMEGGTDTFSFTGHVSGPISTNNGVLQQDVTPGEYTATEAALAGWDLISIQCDDDNSTGDEATRTATFRVAAGETVTCTFTNTKRGQILIDKVTNPSGDPTSFNFSMTGPSAFQQNFSLTDAASPHTSGLIRPGTYNATETIPTGWDLTSATCSNGSEPSNINVAAGETVTCTFTNTRRGNIVIVKNTIGGNGTFAFEGTGGLGNFSLTTTGGSATETFNNLTPGEYSVTETVPTGWDLTELTCNDSSGDTSTSGRTANIDLAAGETVTCTFTNTRRGNIVIVKNTIGGNGTFAFESTGGLGNFNLTTSAGTATETFNNRTPGTYSVTETNPTPTFDFTSLNCVDPTSNTTTSGRTANINLAAGETVTCTFTNTRRGRIIIEKHTVGGDGSFTYSGNLGSFQLTTSGGTDSRTFNNRTPGSYNVTEAGPVSLFDFISVACIDPSNNSSTSGQTATINLAAGETVTCTFVSAQLISISLSKTATPSIVESDGDVESRQVEYRYEVRNTSLALLPLTNVVLEDDHCEPGNLTGDTNNSGALDIGETWVYTCSTEVAVDTANTATVTAKDFLNRTVSDTATAFVDVRPTVAISKAVTPVARPQPGGLFTFALTVTNTAPERVQIIELSDSYPLSAECLALKEQVLEVGGVASCRYPVTHTQPGTYHNTATVTVREVDASHPLDTTDLEATASASTSFAISDILSSLAATRWAQPNALAAPGGPVAFTLFVTNTSPVDGVTLTTILEDRTGDGSNEDTFPAETICTTTTLAPGASTQCHFSYEVAGAAGETITGKATVQAIDDDNDNVTATATAPVYLLDGAPLTVTKTPRANTITEPGGSVVFDVTIRNHHPASALMLTGLDDSVFGDITVTAQNGANATDCALVTVPAEGMYSCSFSAVISGEAGDLHTNTLTATGRAGDGALYTAQGSAQVVIGAAPAPLTVTKRDTLVTDRNLNGQVNPSDEIQYEITVTNSGKQAGTGITLEDTPDANTALVVGSVVATGGAQVVTGNGVGDTRVKVTLPAPLAVGAGFVVTFRVQIKESLPPAVTTVSNQALVTGDNILPTLSDDPDTPAPGDPTVTPVLGLPNVLLSKSDTLWIDADEDGFPSPGDTLLYELVLTNRGGQVAKEIELTDILDENTTLVVGSVQTSQGEVRQGNTPGDTGVQIAVGNLARDATATFSFQAVIADPLPAGVATVSNQARVTGGNFAPVLSDDPTTDARNDPTVTAVTAAPLLVVSKRDFLYEDADGDDQVGPGDTVFYMIQVQNIGNTTAANVLLTDTPDAQTALLTGKVQASQGEVVSGNSVADTILQVRLDDVPPNTSANIGFRVKINATATEPLANQATVQFTNPNDAAQSVITVLSDDPDTPAVGDPTVTPIKPAQPGGGLIDLLLPFVFR